MKKARRVKNGGPARPIQVQMHVDLMPPGVMQDVGRYRLDIVRDIKLPFIPTVGITIAIPWYIPMDQFHIWSPLLKKTSGPKGAEGLGLNLSFLHIDRVNYHVVERNFHIYSTPEILTTDQFNSVRDFLTDWCGFHVDQHMPD